jgi:hypothetical protein
VVDWLASEKIQEQRQCLYKPTNSLAGRNPERIPFRMVVAAHCKTHEQTIPELCRQRRDRLGQHDRVSQPKLDYAKADADTGCRRTRGGRGHEWIRHRDGKGGMVADP